MTCPQPEELAAQSQLDLQVRTEAFAYRVAALVHPLAVHAAVFVQACGFLDHFDQAERRQRMADPDADLISEIAPELRATQLLARLRQYHLEVRIFGHSLNQAVRLRQARAATEEQLHAIELQREHRSQRIGQVLVFSRSAVVTLPRSASAPNASMRSARSLVSTLMRARTRRACR